MYFNNYLFFFGNTSTLATGITWNGTAWATSGYTGTNMWPIAGNVYNYRAYMIQINEAAYWYSGVNLISGACTKIDLSSVTEQKCTLSSIASFTLSNQTGAQAYQAFIFSNGEVIFYTGSYPDSPNWTIVGRSNIGQPLYVNSVIPYQGDTLLMCDAGVVSIRDLFLRGSEQAISLTVNARMQESWRALVQAIRTALSTPSGPITAGYLVGSIRGVWDSKNDRIIISFPYYLNSSGVATAGSYYFVFDTQRQSWYFQRSFGAQIYDICRYKNDVRMITTASNGLGLNFQVYTKEGATGYQDRNSIDDANVSYDYNVTTAPIPFPKTEVYSVSGIEPILESDLYAETNYQLIADLGRQSTGSQPTNAITTAVAKPMANVGIEANFVQLKISGTTAASKTVGLDLYSFNVWYDAGQKASR
jgi:hypothetical protein